MERIKRFVSATLAFLIVFCIVPIHAIAEGDAEPQETTQETTEPSIELITGFVFAMDENGDPVTRIMYLEIEKGEDIDARLPVTVNGYIDNAETAIKIPVKRWVCSNHTENSTEIYSPTFDPDVYRVDNDVTLPHIEVKRLEPAVEGGDPAQPGDIETPTGEESDVVAPGTGETVSGGGDGVGEGGDNNDINVPGGDEEEIQEGSGTGDNKENGEVDDENGSDGEGDDEENGKNDPFDVNSGDKEEGQDGGNIQDTGMDGNGGQSEGNKECDDKKDEKEEESKGEGEKNGKAGAETEEDPDNKDDEDLNDENFGYSEVIFDDKYVDDSRAEYLDGVGIRSVQDPPLRSTVRGVTYYYPSTPGDQNRPIQLNRDFKTSGDWKTIGRSDAWTNSKLYSMGHSLYQNGQLRHDDGDAFTIGGAFCVNNSKDSPNGSQPYTRTTKLDEGNYVEKGLLAILQHGAPQTYIEGMDTNGGINSLGYKATINAIRFWVYSNGYNNMTPPYSRYRFDARRFTINGAAINLADFNDVDRMRDNIVHYVFQYSDGVNNSTDPNSGDYKLQNYIAQLLVYALNQDYVAPGISLEEGDTIALSWNASKSRYENTVTVTGGFDSWTTPDDTATFGFERNGNELTIYTTTPGATTSINLTGSTTYSGYLYLPHNTNLQPMVALEKTEVVYPFTVEADSYYENGTLQIMKSGANPEITAGNENYSLAGAVYILKQNDTIMYTLPETNESGCATLPGIEVGNYTLEEMTAPPGYALSVGTYSVTIENEQTTTVTYADTDILIDTPLVGSVTLNKATTDESLVKDYEAYSLAGALYVLKQNGATVYTFPATDENGLSERRDIPLGTYVLEEIVASAGHAVSAATKIINITPTRLDHFLDASNTEALNESPAYGSVSITKSSFDPGITDGNSDYHLDGAVYVLKQDGVVMYTFPATNEDGKSELNGIRLGTYVLQEVTASFGYNLSLVTDTIVLNNDTPDLVLDASNTASLSEVPLNSVRGSINITKTSARPDVTEGSDWYSLAGAVYVLKQGNTITHMLPETNENGYAEMSGIMPGTYTLQETQSAYGFRLSSDTATVVIQSGQTTSLNGADVTCLCDEPQQLTIQIVKQCDENYSEIVGDNANYSLAGAVFEVTDGGGNHVASLSQTETTITYSPATSSLGIATVTWLPHQNYYLQEVTAPTGYILDPTPIFVDDSEYIVTPMRYGDYTAGPVITVTIDNIPVTGTISITKSSSNPSVTDNNDSFSLAGAEYVLKQNGSEVLRFPATDEDGHATLDNIPLGVYTLEEVTASRGYNVSTATYTVTVNSATEIELNASVAGCLSEVPISGYIKGSIYLTKSSADPSITDGNDNYSLAGAIYALTQNGEVKYEFPPTREDGTTELHGIDLGIYLLEELTPSPGYSFAYKYETPKLYLWGQPTFVKATSDISGKFIDDYYTGQVGYDSTYNLNDAHWRYMCYDFSDSYDSLPATYQYPSRWANVKLLTKTEERPSTSGQIYIKYREDFNATNAYDYTNTYISSQGNYTYFNVSKADFIRKNSDKKIYITPVTTNNTLYTLDSTISKDASPALVIVETTGNSSMQKAIDVVTLDETNLSIALNSTNASSLMELPIVGIFRGFKWSIDTSLTHDNENYSGNYSFEGARFRLDGPNGFTKTVEIVSHTNNGFGLIIPFEVLLYENGAVKPHINYAGTIVDVDGGFVDLGVDGSITEQGSLFYLPLGDYTLTEIRAPKGYKNNETAYTFSVSENDLQSRWETVIVFPTEYLYSDGSIQYFKFKYPYVPTDLTIRNSPYRGPKVTITKSSENSTITDGNDAYSLAGAIYILTQNDVEVYRFPATDENGYAELEEVPYGTYTLQEITPSQGYTVSNATYTFTISDLTQIDLTASDTLALSEPPVVTTGSITIHKRSSLPDLTGNNPTCYSLQGAEYEIRDDNGVLIETLTTDANGDATTTVPLPIGVYTITETVASEGYRITEGSTTVPITTSTAFSLNSVITMYEEPINDPVMIRIVKVDSVTGESEPRGGASLSGAQFTVKYYPEVMSVIPDGATPERVWVIETNENGFTDITEEFKVSGDNFFVNELGDVVFPLGTLSIQETLSPEGYNLPVPNDPVVYMISSDSGSQVITYTIYEPVQTGTISIEKRKMDRGNDYSISEATAKANSIPEAGVTFFVYPESVGTFMDTDEIDRDILVTDSNGRATSKQLPYGTYILQQVDGDEETQFSDYILVTISENGQTVTVPTIYNEVIYTKLKISKVDTETGETIEQAGIQFRLLDENDNFLENIVTGPDGTYTTAIGYKNGSYKLVEVIAPDGYAILSSPFEFTIDEQTADPLNIIEIEIENHRQDIRILVTKTGLVCTGISTETKNGHSLQVPQFANGGIRGVSFELYAKQDILSNTGAVKYAAGMQIGSTVTTNSLGLALFQNLLPGVYELIESNEIDGYVKSTTRTITISNTSEPEVTINEDVENTLRTVNITLTKQAQVYNVASGTYSYTTMAGFEFGLYTAQEFIFKGAGWTNYTIPANTLLEVATTDSFGNITFSNHYLGGSYYIKELCAPAGYTIDSANKPITVEIDSSSGDTVNVIYSGELKNDLGKAAVHVVKTNTNDGSTVAIAGTKFEIRDTNNTLYATIITDNTGVATSPMALPYGTYTVTEITAPTGFILDTMPRILIVSESTLYSTNDYVRFEFDDIPGNWTINVTKTGPALTSTTTTTTGEYTVTNFVYETRNLPNVRFDLYAKTAISSGSEVIYTAGEKVTSAISNANGVASFSGLYLGTYEIREVEGMTGAYVLPASGSYPTVTVSSYGSTLNTSMTNTVRNVSFSFNKYVQPIGSSSSGNDVTPNYPISHSSYVAGGTGFTFGLYTKTTIEKFDGTAIAADTLVDVAHTDINGLVTFTGNYPEGTYYVRELSQPDAFQNGGIVIDNITVLPNDLTVSSYTITLSDVYNDLDLKTVSIIKVDKDSSDPLSGAVIEILDSEDTVLFRGTTGSSGVLSGIQLAPGTYTLHEDTPPDDYAASEDIIFVVTKAGTVTINGNTVSNNQLVIEDEFINVPSITLPKTGSNAAIIISAIGCAIVLGGAAFQLVPRRKKRED